MERQKKILDASVLVKIFSEEEDSKEVFTLIKKHISGEIIIIVPELLFLEVINALKYKKNNFQKTEEANEDLWNFQLKIQKLNKNIIDVSINISLNYNITIYDSIYIALAKVYGCELITADEKLIKVPNVKLLKDVR